MIGLLVSRIVSIVRLTAAFHDGYVNKGGLEDFVISIDAYLLVVVLLHSPIVLLQLKA